MGIQTNFLEVVYDQIQWTIEDPDSARWAEKMNRNEPSLNELMQTEDGRQIWEQHGTTWIGEFFLAKGHVCSLYLKMYLERKGIDVDMEED